MLSVGQESLAVLEDWQCGVADQGLESVGRLVRLMNELERANERASTPYLHGIEALLLFGIHVVEQEQQVVEGVEVGGNQHLDRVEEGGLLAMERH